MGNVLYGTVVMSSSDSLNLVVWNPNRRHFGCDYNKLSALYYMFDIDILLVQYLSLGSNLLCFHI